MKKYPVLFILVTMMFAACAPKQTPTEQPLIPVEDSIPDASPTSTHIPVDLTPAQRAAITALSDITNLSADKITLVSTTAVTWPDGCLGVQRMGMMCTQALVEGYRIILKADGREYEFHTNQNGSAVVLAAGEFPGLGEDSLIAQLAENLGLNKNDIAVVSRKDVEFADACMDVAMQDVMCAQVITPGKIIVLEANGIQYEYHTSVDRSRVQPATVALTWKREGGIAGFCDNMTVFLSGEVYVNNCKGQPEGRMVTFATLLTASELKQFNAWIEEFGQADLDASDPEGVSDRMVRTLSFFGNGNGKLVVSDEEALFTWAQDLFQKASE